MLQLIAENALTFRVEKKVHAIKQYLTLFKKDDKIM